AIQLFFKLASASQLHHSINQFNMIIYDLAEGLALSHSLLQKLLLFFGQAAFYVLINQFIQIPIHCLPLYSPQKIVSSNAADIYTSGSSHCLRWYNQT